MSEVTAAVKKLRLALRDSQQSFASRLEIGIATVVRYEHNRPPSGRYLVKLEQLARENGYEEYAAVFREALGTELGSCLPVVAYDSLNCKTYDERDYVGALLSILRGSPDSKEAGTIKKVLTPQVVTLRQLRESEEAFNESQRAVIKMLKAGRSVEDVAKYFRAEAIADALIELGGPALVEEHMAPLVEVLVSEGRSADEIAERWFNSDLDHVTGILVDRGLHHAVPDGEPGR